MRNRALIPIRRSPKLVAAILLTGLLFLAFSQPSDAQSTASCQQVIQYLDMNDDGQSEAMVLTCQFTPETHDRLTIYKHSGNVLPDIPWQQNIAYEHETWIFDHGVQGKASLIINFRRDGTSMVAQIYDDRDQDGEVRYEINNGQAVITESQYWTVQVVAPNGWWIRDDVLNYNLHIQVDGDVEGMFMMEPYRSYLVTDGKPDYDIQIYDQNHNGKPEYDKRMILTPSLQGSVGLGTQMMANWADDEMPVSGGFSLWPYLDLAYEHQSGTRVVKGNNHTPPPIKFEPAAGRIEGIGEFVASRGGDQNCFYYSTNPWVAGQLNETDFESPFCFYELAEDGDRIPGLQVRAVYWPPKHRAFLGGQFSDPYVVIRYSWDQDNSVTWRYAVGLVGRHQIDSVVTFVNIDVLTIPYNEFPHWVTEREWDMAIFSEFTGESYYTSEGNYSVSYLEDLQYAEYFTGRADSAPSPEYEPDVDFTMEWAMDHMSQPYLYFSPVDRRLHLWAAQGGAWNLGDGHYIRYANLNGDAYLDQWQEEREGKVFQQLNYSQGVFVYSGNGGVQLKQTPIMPALFKTLPPGSHDEWQQLDAQLKANPNTFSPNDFTGMLNQFPGSAIHIQGADAGDYRVTPQGFRFILELQPGFSTSLNQEMAVILPESAGTFVVEYENKTWSIQPITPPVLYIDDLQVVAREGDLHAWGWASVEAIVRNDGLEDVRDLTICASIVDPENQQQVLTTTVSLLPGAGQRQLTWVWTPEESGTWTVRVETDCGDTSDRVGFGQASDSLLIEVAPSTAPDLRWFASLGDMVSGETWLILLGAMLLIAGTGIFWIKQPVGR